MKTKILILCLGLFCSCATFRDSKIAENQKELTKENISQINGMYINNAKSIAVPMDYFWGSYYRNKEYHSVYKSISENNPYYISLKAINDRKIRAEIIVNGTILKLYEIKGKIRNGYFEQNRKTYIIPALLANIYHSSNLG